MAIESFKWWFANCIPIISYRPKWYRPNNLPTS